jgi:hypothetical protein
MAMTPIKVAILIVAAGIFITWPIYADNVDVYPLSSTPQIYLTGKIGNYPVAMTLFLYPKTIYGFYSYEGKNSFLELAGELDSGRILLYEYVHHENTGVFEGKVLLNNISGIWKSANKMNASSLPFDLSSKAGSFESDHIRSATDRMFLVTSSNQSAVLDLNKELSYSVISCKKVFSEKKNDELYIVILLEEFSLGGCRERGYCGCGVETHLVWVHLKRQFNILKKSTALVGSCTKNIDPEEGGEIEEFFSDRNRTTLRVSGELFAGEYGARSEIGFDKNYPEKGITSGIPQKKK